MKKINKNHWFFQVLPLLLAFLSISIVRTELGITIVVVLLLALSFWFRYYKGEWKVLIIGILAGIFLEVGGDMLYQLQYWAQGSLMGIPIWLPIFWGYVFVFTRRIGNIIVKKKN
jgi:membrane-bound metal-dependent hydrolase YbcI (DUF457 family)